MLLNTRERKLNLENLKQEEEIRKVLKSNINKDLGEKRDTLEK